MLNKLSSAQLERTAEHEYYLQKLGQKLIHLLKIYAGKHPTNSFKLVAHQTWFAWKTQILYFFLFCKSVNLLS